MLTTVWILSALALAAGPKSPKKQAPQPVEAPAPVEAAAPTAPATTGEPLPEPMAELGTVFEGDAAFATMCEKAGLVFFRDETHIGCYPDGNPDGLPEWTLAKPADGTWRLGRMEGTGVPGGPITLQITTLTQRMAPGVSANDAMNAFLEKHGRDGLSD